MGREHARAPAPRQRSREPDEEPRLGGVPVDDVGARGRAEPASRGSRRSAGRGSRAGEIACSSTALPSSSSHRTDSRGHASASWNRAGSSDRTRSRTWCGTPECSGWHASSTRMGVGTVIGTGYCCPTRTPGENETEGSGSQRVDRRAVAPQVDDPGHDGRPRRRGGRGAPARDAGLRVDLDDRPQPDRRRPGAHLLRHLRRRRPGLRRRRDLGGDPRRGRAPHRRPRRDQRPDLQRHADHQDQRPRPRRRAGATVGPGGHGRAARAGGAGHRHQLVEAPAARPADGRGRAGLPAHPPDDRGRPAARPRTGDRPGAAAGEPDDEGRDAGGARPRLGRARLRRDPDRAGASRSSTPRAS